jgi:oxygen-independent coproporphyrinogen-3 oxidase
LPDNLYVHFPFCRARCSYCTLFSRTGSTVQSRKEYVKRIADALSCAEHGFKTVYFGGGSPALCDLKPVFDAIHGAGEFTVELHPLDVDEGTLLSLKAGGVNRISMGVQSLDDDILAHMGRGYTFEEAERAFATGGADPAGIVQRVYVAHGERLSLLLGDAGDPGFSRPCRMRQSGCSLRLSGLGFRAYI